jgi:tetratricopeptide (TPR) repeat protein
MRIRHVVASASLAGLVAVAGIGATRLPQAPTAAPKPEVVSPLGKSFVAKPDTSGAIAKVDAALAKDPKNIDLLLDAAGARATVLQFADAIRLYTQVIALAPADVRAYRFRGHRYISTRRFDLAVADLEKATQLAPTSYDVAYHLGLAKFLKGDFAGAAAAYGRCLAAKTGAGPLPQGWRDCSTVSTDDESRVSISDWLYRSLRRAGRPDEAKRLLDGISDTWPIKDNAAYYDALLFYKGLRTETQIIPADAFKENTGVTTGYGIANFYLAQGQTEQACALLRRIVDDEAHWNAFGFIAAETDLTRPGGPCPR